MDASIANVADTAARPISEASPTGASIRYDPDFEVLKREIDKISGPAADVDWKKVVSLSSGILEKKSKDMLVASYLCVGLLQTAGYPGLAEGLEALRRILDAFWEGLFPEASRMKGRVAAAGWLAERVAIVVRQKDPAAADRAAIQAGIEKLGQVDGILREKIGGDAPSLRDAMSALEERLAETEPQAGAGAAGGPALRTAGEPAAAGAPQAVMRVAAEEDDLTTPEGLQRAVDASIAKLREAAAQIRKNDAKDPLAYRFTRIAAWAQLGEMPAHEDGKTRIPPLGASYDVAARFSEMAAQRDWSNLLDQAEYQFEQSVFWIDSQRFVAAALDGLGAGYEAALEVVKTELGSLLRRFPGIADLRFDDDLPFASPETRTWIQQEVLPAGQAGASAPAPAAAAASNQDERIAEVSAEARTLAKKRRMGEAVALFRKAADEATSRRQRFQRRFAMARFLEDNKEHRLAIAHLEALDEEIRTHRLEEWDPAVALEVLRLYLVCQRMMVSREWRDSPEAQRKAEDLYLRIARLDAAAVLGM